MSFLYYLESSDPFLYDLDHWHVQSQRYDALGKKDYVKTGPSLE